MNFILTGIQWTGNFLFLAVVLGTVIVSWVYAHRLRERHGADFPWNKAASIIGVEVLLWIAFNVFLEFFKAYWLPIAIIAVVVIAVILSRKKKRRYV